MRDLRCSITGLKSPFPNPISQVAGTAKGEIPSTGDPSRLPGEDIIDVYERWIAGFYQKAAGVDVTQLNKEVAFKYRVWMDTCRKMQTIIDKDCGDHSQEAKVALRALRALLVVPA